MAERTGTTGRKRAEPSATEMVAKLSGKMEALEGHLRKTKAATKDERFKAIMDTDLELLAAARRRLETMRMLVTGIESVITAAQLHQSVHDGIEQSRTRPKMAPTGAASTT